MTLGKTFEERDTLNQAVVRVEPWRATSGVARAHHDGHDAASPGRDTNTGQRCR